jgi:hypothetical protein
VSEGRPRRIDGWSAFLGWLLVGGLLGFAVLGAASVGALALPFIVILVVMTRRARPPSHSLVGLIAGVGVLLLFIGILNLGNTPCDETGTLIDGVIVYGYVEAGIEEDGAKTSCGGRRGWRSEELRSPPGPPSLPSQNGETAVARSSRARPNL